MLTCSADPLPRPCPSGRGFSLVEVIAVMAIIVILLTLVAPIAASFSTTAGRKGAVDILMTTLDQARAAALQNGTEIYVLLWRREFPDKDAIMVIRKPSEWGQKADGTQETQLVPLTKWIALPSGVLLHKPAKGENVFSSDGWPQSLRDRKNEIPRLGGEELKEDDVGIVWYSPSGAVLQPTGTKARIILTEGVRGVGGTEARISESKQSQQTGGGFDVISLARFTGRPQLDVTTLDQ